jgi:hypothetical protein
VVLDEKHEGHEGRLFMGITSRATWPPTEIRRNTEYHISTTFSPIKIFDIRFSPLSNMQFATYYLLINKISSKIL